MKLVIQYDQAFHQMAVSSNLKTLCCIRQSGELQACYHAHTFGFMCVNFDSRTPTSLSGLLTSPFFARTMS